MNRDRIDREIAAYQEKLATEKPRAGDELCLTCGHVRWKHLFGDRSCGDEASRCACIQFVPSGTFFDYKEDAMRSAALDVLPPGTRLYETETEQTEEETL